MLEMFGEILPLAIGVALSPLPIIAVLMLNTPLSPASAPAFLVGRVFSVIVLVAFFAVVSDSAAEAGETETIVSLLRIAAGVGLVALAARKWRKRPGKGDEVELPRWMAMVDGAGPARSFGLALLLSVNPKEVLFRVGAGATIGAATLGVSADVATAAVYGIVACSTVALPVVAALVAPERMREPLDRTRDWLVRNNGVIIGVVLLLVGVALIGGGIGDL